MVVAQYCPILQVVPCFCSPLKSVAGKGTRHWCRCSLELSQVQLRFAVRDDQSHIELFTSCIRKHLKTQGSQRHWILAMTIVPSLYHPCTILTTLFLLFNFNIFKEYLNIFKHFLTDFSYFNRLQCRSPRLRAARLHINFGEPTG